MTKHPMVGDTPGQTLSGFEKMFTASPHLEELDNRIRRHAQFDSTDTSKRFTGTGRRHKDGKHAEDNTRDEDSLKCQVLGLSRGILIFYTGQGPLSIASSCGGEHSGADGPASREVHQIVRAFSVKSPCPRNHFMFYIIVYQQHI